MRNRPEQMGSELHRAIRWNFHERGTLDLLLLLKVSYVVLADTSTPYANGVELAPARLPQSPSF